MAEASPAKSVDTELLEKQWDLAAVYRKVLECRRGGTHACQHAGHAPAEQNFSKITLFIAKIGQKRENWPKKMHIWHPAFTDFGFSRRPWVE